MSAIADKKKKLQFAALIVASAAAMGEVHMALLSRNERARVAAVAAYDCMPSFWLGRLCV